MNTKDKYAFRYGFIFTNKFSYHSLTMYTTERLSADDLLNILALSNHATAVYTTENIFIETANDKMIAAWQKDRSVIGKTMAEALPELEGQPFIGILKNVWRTGITYNAIAMPTDIEANGKMKRYYFDFEYRAIKKNDGSMLCILHTASNVTEGVMNEQVIKANETELLKLNRDLARANRDLAESNRELQLLNENLFTAQKDMSIMYARLVASEEKFRSIIEQIPIAVNVLRSRDLVIELINEKFIDLWAKKVMPDEVIGKTILEVNPEFEGQPFMQHLDDVYTSGITYRSRNEKGTVMRNGVRETGYYHVIFHPLINNQGEVYGILQIAANNTNEILATQQIQELNEELGATNEELAAGNEELRALNEEMQLMQDHLVRANRELTESEGRFRSMAESTSMFIGVSNESGNAVYFNRIWTDVTGLSTDHLLKFGWLNYVHPDDKEKAARLFTEAIEKRTAFTSEYRLLTREGNYIWLLAEVLPRRHANGSFAGHIGSAVDITERRRDDQRKNDFIGMVSHELKTPLTSLGGYIEIVKSDLINEGNTFNATLLKKATKQVSKMTTMINGFLNVSRLESGKLLMQKRRFDMAKLIDEARDEMKGLYNNHNIIFEEVEETFVYADWDKLGHVLNNFVSNAAKYSTYGTSIQVACVIVEGRAQVSVQDKGIGIMPEDQEHLFERYYRVETNNTRAISGFGIGLYLCAEIIHRNDGNIWVESEPGKGSVFYFSLPVVE